MNFLLLELSLLDRPSLIIDQPISYVNGLPENPSHPPNSWHSYAASMQGKFISAPHADLKEYIEWADFIVATVNYRPDFAHNIIANIKKLGKKVLFAFHENGDLLQHNAKNLDWLIQFRNCANICDGILTYPHHDLFSKIYEGMGITVPQFYVPQPVDLNSIKKFRTNKEDRKGIFIGPQLKEQEIEHRNFIFNVLMATYYIKQHKHIYPIISILNNSPIANINLRDKLQKLCPTITFQIFNKQPYEQYLQLLAEHQYYINFDTSATQGQVDLDALSLDIDPLIWDIGFGTDYAHLYKRHFEKSPGSITPLNFVNTCCTFAQCRETFEEIYHQLCNKN